MARYELVAQPAGEQPDGSSSPNAEGFCRIACRKIVDDGAASVGAGVGENGGFADVSISFTQSILDLHEQQQGLQLVHMHRREPWGGE